MHRSCHSFNDGQHHGDRGRVGDPHGEEGRRRHEPEHDHLRGSPNQEEDLEGNPLVEARVLDADGHHEAAQEHEVRRLHVVDRHLVLKQFQK